MTIKATSTAIGFMKFFRPVRHVVSLPAYLVLAGLADAAPCTLREGAGCGLDTFCGCVPGTGIGAGLRASRTTALSLGSILLAASPEF